MKTSILISALLLSFGVCACGGGGDDKVAHRKEAKDKTMSTERIEIIHNQVARQVDVTVGGQPFTSYCYWEKLKKPVLYPLRADDGRIITRGYPIKPLPGDRVDHPHHVSCWFNYGDVNGDDFWGHSMQSAPGGKKGTIVHRSVDSFSSGVGQAHLDVTMHWIGSAGDKVLEEKDRIYFRTGPGLRIIDRVIRLKALDKKVVFGDTKEGMFAIRVRRGLEEPADSGRPLKYVDATGQITEVAKLDNTGVDGEYLSSEGGVGEKGVWGTRAKWCILRGTLEDKQVTVGIFDHPENVGYPTYWHARGYGLFSANPLGWKTFTKGEKELNFTLQPGEQTTLRYRILIASRRLDKEETERLYQKWLEEIAQ